MDYSKVLEDILLLEKVDREYVIYQLLLMNKISYTELSKWYVASLQRQKDRDLSIKAELAACLLQESMYQRSRKSKWVKEQINILIHRSIAILDVVDCFQLDAFKKKHNYQEEVGKKQGQFWNTWEKI